jgi:1,5-anhydro-D-fructose reductase (1,5-anhydro-D-mannitol-forming)
MNLTPRPKSLTRIALVGSSGFAVRAAAAITRAPVEFVGVLGSTLERSNRFARELGVQAGYASLEDLALDASVDAVWIACHYRLHKEFAVACMNAGKHVLLETPMAASIAEASAIVAAAERNGVVLRLGCHERFRPVFQDLRARASGGSLGKIGFVRLHHFLEVESNERCRFLARRRHEEWGFLGLEGTWGART